MNTADKKFRWLGLAGIVAVSGLLGYAAVRHGLAEHWAASSNPNLWRDAARIEPKNPENWYHLGRYRQLDFENGDLPEAIVDYRRAAAIQPLTAQYWLDLAGAYETAGDGASAEDAYRHALVVYPISGEVAWRYGNFLLRQNRVDDGFRQIQNAVRVEPALAALAVSRCWYSAPDVDRILDNALPATPEGYWGAVQFFVTLHQPEAAMAAWRRLASFKTSFPMAQATPLLDLLLQMGYAEDARSVWGQALTAAGITPSPVIGGSLVWDGGFEGDLLNVGFAWRYQPVQGAELQLDQQTVHSGRRSLQINFDGSANLDFAQIWQYVAVEPGHKYRFSAYTRTEELTTDKGIHFDIQDAVHPDISYPPTPDVVGTQSWALDDVGFTTGPRTHLLRVMLRREKSSLIGNKIRGTVWVDDVSLIPMDVPAK